MNNIQLAFLLLAIHKQRMVLMSYQPEPVIAEQKSQWTGWGSYYTIDGCIGCREDRLMANQEKLDDSKLTVAFNYLPLNTVVEITNFDNGKSVIARVTDRGGFEKYNRIIDVSWAVKEAIDLKTDQSIIRVEAK
jgi:rare lipoprotein A